MTKSSQKLESKVEAIPTIKTIKPTRIIQARAVDTQPMIIPATAKPRFSLLPDFFSFEREIWPKIEPINEKKPAVRNNVANEVIKEAIASPLPDFASCSA